jgi:hypothetical protein
LYGIFPIFPKTTELPQSGKYSYLAKTGEKQKGQIIIIITRNDSKIE